MPTQNLYHNICHYMHAKTPVTNNREMANSVIFIEASDITSHSFPVVATGSLKETFQGNFRKC